MLVRLFDILLFSYQYSFSPEPHNAFTQQSCRGGAVYVLDLNTKQPFLLFWLTMARVCLLRFLLSLSICAFWEQLSVPRMYNTMSNTLWLVHHLITETSTVEAVLLWSAQACPLDDKQRMSESLSYRQNSILLLFRVFARVFIHLWLLFSFPVSGLSSGQIRSHTHHRSSASLSL